MLDRDPTAMSSSVAPLHGRRTGERRRGAASLLAAVTAGVGLPGEPRAARGRLEEELRAALQARSVILRDEPAPLLAPNTACFDVPFGYGDTRARLEILFETPRPLDEWSCQVIDMGTQLAALILELERAAGRLTSATRRPCDGAAPLIGSSEAIRRVRERIERVAATDFTVLIEGESGPEPHPISIGFSCGATTVSPGSRVEEATGRGEEDRQWTSLLSWAVAAQACREPRDDLLIGLQGQRWSPKVPGSGDD